MLVRRVAIPRERDQTAAISGLESNGNSGSHARRARVESGGNPLRDTNVRFDPLGAVIHRRSSVSQLLTHQEFAQLIRLAPLVAIDLIIRDSTDRIFLGLRINEPAKGVYFVPGGRIRKGERHREAFARISKNETNHQFNLEDARLLGVYDHIYSTNALEEPGYGTHCVTIGYELHMMDTSNIRSNDQHSKYRWMTEEQLLESQEVHEYTKAYFIKTPKV